MARKYDLISELYNRTCKTVVSNPQNWQAFLASACRNYKLRYDEQLLVYAQRPDATAVLEIEQWNRIFGRWVNRGARGIAVFADENRTRQRLTHYFDISDTHESKYSRTVPIWDMRQEYEADVIETLESTFGEIENKSSLAEAIMGAARNAAEDNIPDYLQDLYYATEVSFLEEVDNDIVASIYKNVVANSVAYMMMSRLGVDTDGYFELDDFRDVTNFNTQETLNALGFATSDIAEMGLTEVSKTITALNRQNRIIVGQDRNEYNKVENNDERSLDNERTDLHNGGRLQPSEPETSTAAGSDFGQIRSDEEKVSEGTSQSPLLQSPDEGRTDTALGGSGTESQQDGGNNPEPDGTERGSDRTDESRGYDEMGLSDELPSQLGTGNRESGSDIRLEDIKPLPDMGGQLSFIQERAEEQTTSAFSIPKEIIDNYLASGSGFANGKYRIYEQYQKSLSLKENADFLKKEYGTGGGTYAGGVSDYNYDCDAKGVRIRKGYEENAPEIRMNWTEVAKEIGRLISDDRYLNKKEWWNYPEWLAEQEVKRARVAEQVENREVMSTVPAQKEPEEQEMPQDVEYEYHLGDKVYIGASEYEILSIDDERVMLYDYDMPLFNKEFSHIEFDEKVRENPMNEHLIVKEVPTEERNVTVDYNDAFFINQDNATVTWIYYNPDSAAGGQYVTNILNFDEITEIAKDSQTSNEFFDRLGSIANQTLADVGTEWFSEAESRFLEKPDFTDCTQDTMQSLVSEAEKSSVTEVQTNMGSMPIEDYREIVASQSGFDSYDEMYKQGYRIGNGYDKEPEPVVPAWEQKKKVKGFDLHPDVPMADRHTFNLRENEVETVGKKERFRRNIMAIQLLKKCQEENRFATPEEQIVLSKYVGWGGLSEAFDENNSAWATEYLELSSVLTPEEYASARESTLTAFYTPPEVITAIYKAMEQMGFKEGNLLEPSCGIGNFIGMLPDTMQDSKIYGVELDRISAGIAQQLYQKTTIAAQGFEETNLPDSFFDGVVGNVPFGDFKVSDKRYDKYKFLIHDYFFAKSLDKLRPGGVMALVTSKGTMDKENSAVRKYIAQRAELLGAIRLPNNTFKGNAGTEVVSDILILQKRDRLIDIEPDWVHLDTDENGIKMNSYFVQHPEMILGEMKMVSGRFGMEATCVPYENADLAAQLDEAVANIHGEITEYEAEEELEEEDNSIPADPTVRNFSYTVVDDKIYYRENSRMTPVEVSATAENRIKGMIAIRNSVRTLIELQTEDYPDSEIKAEQERLNRLYDTFSGKYGLINSRANTSAFSQDSSFSLLSALEIIGEDGELERKADMFSKRTIKPHTPVTSVDTASEALAVSLGEKATIDMDYMMELSGKSENEIFEDLKGVIFLNPLYEYGNSYEPKYLMADEYLSGNVREKLRIAKNSAELYPEDYKVNVEALQKVQPKDLTASEISVRLGATWLPPDDVQEFIFHLLETPRYAQWNIKVHFSPFTSEWNIEGKSYDKGNVRAYNTYGTSRINAYKIIEETLNLKDVRIFDYIEDDEGRKKAVLNKKETAIAQSKQEMIKQEFQDWIWSDPERRERLCKFYNEKFNSVRPREYDGSHIIFNGMNPEIELREHQKNAVAHILYGGNTLLAHAVGAGKTFEMVAAAQESKRLGLCNKSLFVVPNHLTEQWAAEYLQLYPAANILVATKKDFETKNRKKFCGRIATGDYDAVIIGHSQFEKIPMSIERQRAILEQQLEEITGGIAELKRNRGENFSIKQFEKSKKSIKQKLDKLNDQTKKDDVVTFEELGVDRLFVDESHYYKNLYLYTKMRNVGGIAQTEAQKSSDLFMKCRYLDEITGGRGTVFATGTPISNSMVELYTIQRYLQYNTLVKNGLQHFDAWASTFGETITAVELTPEGTGYRAKTRFAKFYNLPELMAMFKEIADIKTADMLNLPVPEAKYHNIAVKPSEMQKEMVASLAERAEQVRGGGVDSSVDNMLKITNDGRKLALDQRMLNDMLPDFEGSKINACVDNIYRIWKENADKKSAQLVFCDLSTPKNDGTFSVYNDIRKKLIERGIPESEVKFIHEADTDMKKKELFQKTRKGEVRVLLGSTQKMGAGTNVQDKLIALHDVDCPWRPSDLEQRSGRIVRQGNENPQVDIYRYVTEQTFDAYLYQLVEGKQKFASQIMTSKSPVRSAEDIDETALSYAEIKMLATGNPYIKEKMDLDIQVQKLKMLKSNFLSEKYGLEDKVIKFYPQQIAYLKSRVEGLTKDVETAKLHPKPIDEQPLGMMVSGVSYSEKAEAGQAIINACKSMNSPDAIPLGEYRGFQMELYFDTVQRNYVVKLKGETSRDIPLGDDAHGNIVRIDNGIERFEETLADTKNSLENTEKQFETAKQEIEKPFAKEEEVRAKTARLDELNILLNMDKKENEIVGGEPDEGEAVGGRKEKSYER
ncbi:helicase [Blautia sp. AF32-4BH]|jgi:N12 class adenine-specific DNA methylase/adenine-specific DNA methylase|uniref:DEAD/DEAH box helicase family protein n=1 Tax=Lachnospiraceae TaxID=186803 RepID=UPI00082064F8|nr:MULTISPECIES: DEAD/DEAH box helicase family protein [Lachnospiraceae]RGF63285.1 helicase [Blautia sp. AF32-4BH]RHO41839.1 helicase [Dorea sp. AM13-35]SCG97108.1 DNA methylase [uncultured Ruminococcus sp.]SCH87093.1 DNA methylase [uncultured Coprococcus sp.]